MKSICLILSPFEAILPGGMARQRRGLLMRLTFLVVASVCFLQIGCQQEAGAAGESKPILTVPKAATVPSKVQTKPQTEVGPRIKFDELIHDFGKVGLGTSNKYGFKFKNTGDATLKIARVQTCCGVVANLSGNKKEYAPGESGTVKVTYRATRSGGGSTKRLYVPSNDESKPKVTLSIKAKIVPKAATVPSKAQTKSKTGRIGPRIKFDKLTHDFGKIGPGTSNTCEFKFTNTGNALLKITKVQACCGFRARLKGRKKEYAPGESGTVTVTFNASKSRRTLTKYQYVSSNDKTRPKTKLTVKARIVPQVAYEPEKLKFLLEGENTGCPPITLRSLDGRPFSVKLFKSTGNCITAEYDSSAKATKFVLKPEVDIEKLKKNLNGRINIGLTHPECNMVTIFFETLPRFTVKPVSIIVFNAEPQKPIKRQIWILNNYGEDFEVESASSKKGIVEVLSQQKLGKRYKFELQITPPAAEDKTKIFTDVFFVNIKGGEKLKANCNGFYAGKRKDSSSR